MNELLQKHGCSNVFSIPEGLRELMADMTREVLREQPDNIYDFLASYLSALLITRENGLMSVKILDDLCDCRLTVSEHLLDAGIPKDTTHMLAEIIQTAIEANEPEAGSETVKESDIVKKALQVIDMDEQTTAKVCQVARNAFRDYWYRKKKLEEGMKEEPQEPWERAAENTLRIYKTTKPTFSELTRAAKIIQAAYRGYHLRRQTLMHLRKPPTARSDRSATPVDTAGSREIELGPLLDVEVGDDDVQVYFDEEAEKNVKPAQSIKRITHIPDKSKSSHTLMRSTCSMATLGPENSRKDRVMDYSQTTRSDVVSARITPSLASSKAGPEVTKSQVGPSDETTLAPDE